MNCSEPPIACLDYEAALIEAVDALRLYADPASYHAILFHSDHPAGWFSSDFSDGPVGLYNRPMPGKMAREALARIDRLLKSAIDHLGNAAAPNRRA